MLEELRELQQGEALLLKILAVLVPVAAHLGLKILDVLGLYRATAKCQTHTGRQQCDNAHQQGIVLALHTICCSSGSHTALSVSLPDRLPASGPRNESDHDMSALSPSNATSHRHDSDESVLMMTQP